MYNIELIHNILKEYINTFSIVKAEQIDEVSYTMTITHNIDLVDHWQQNKPLFLEEWLSNTLLIQLGAEPKRYKDINQIAVSNVEINKKKLIIVLLLAH